MPYPKLLSHCSWVDALPAGGRTRDASRRTSPPILDSPECQMPCPKLAWQLRCIFCGRTRLNCEALSSHSQRFWHYIKFVCVAWRSIAINSAMQRPEISLTALNKQKRKYSPSSMSHLLWSNGLRYKCIIIVRGLTECANVVHILILTPAIDCPCKVYSDTANMAMAGATQSHCLAFK